MTALALGSNDRFIDRAQNTGSSDAAYKIKAIFDSAIEELRNSLTWNPLYELGPELQEIITECHAEDWDGENACPITQATYSEAFAFIENLPMGLPLPELVPEPEGDIGFEWNRGKNKIFVASINGTGVITYAGLFGKNRKTHGEEAFDENIPQNIIDNIRRVYK
ncbi:MAG: hypothetical protein AB2603_17295 [Candidatus Thiodiazotropha endolucinida]